jgi:pSer/pThr/pTyr-binding forkhead associated (FHA) protein
LIAGRTGSSPDSNEGKPLPDIDLLSFNALDHGVSRQHAAFVYRDEELSVEDLNSTNGTRINGFQIMPGRIYRLRNGDELEFGRLRMTIKIVRAPH